MLFYGDRGLAMLIHSLNKLTGNEIESLLVNNDYKDKTTTYEKNTFNHSNCTIVHNVFLQQGKVQINDSC